MKEVSPRDMKLYIYRNNIYRKAFMIVDFIESSSRAHLFESCGDESLCMKDFWHDRTYISSNCIKSGVM